MEEINTHFDSHPPFNLRVFVARKKGESSIVKLTASTKEASKHRSLAPLLDELAGAAAAIVLLRLLVETSLSALVDDPLPFRAY